MWSSLLTDQAKTGWDWTAVATILAALIALAGVLLVAFVTLRTSKSTEDSRREADLDDRVDAELTRVTGDRDRLRAENDRLRGDYDTLWTARQAVLEREITYRRWIREQGGNPEEVLAGG